MAPCRASQPPDTVNEIAGGEAETFPMLMRRIERAPASLGMITLDEDLDEHSEHRLLAEVGQAIEGGVAAIVLDCSKLRYLTPFGLASMLRIRKRLKSRYGSGQGRLRLASARPSVLHVIRSANLDSAFSIYDDVAQALIDTLPTESTDATGPDTPGYEPANDNVAMTA
ncbi:MAG: STAS domain-containing protein [Planctomycetota bacterium]